MHWSDTDLHKLGKIDIHQLRLFASKRLELRLEDGLLCFGRPPGGRINAALSGTGAIKALEELDEQSEIFLEFRNDDPSRVPSEEPEVWLTNRENHEEMGAVLAGKYFRSM
jgi:hypothetical protein